jgi:putative two-component system response regulator
MLRDRTEKKRLEMDLLESYRKLQHARAATILGLAKLAEYRDEGTGTHLERIREYARLLAEEMAKIPRYRGYIDQRYIDDIYQSAILHDIGKVGIPDAVLLKPGELTGEEFEVIKCHTLFGGDAITSIQSQIEGRSFLNIGREIAYNHHEKWDGSGYPRGLRGADIPLAARIVAVADVYDALTTKRFYKEAFSHVKAMQIISSLRGTHFDPEVVDAFLALEGQFNRIREEKLKHEQKVLPSAGSCQPGVRQAAAV